MSLDPADLTAQQRRVYPHWKAGETSGDIARATGLPGSRVNAIFAELRRMEKTGGRRTSLEATRAEEETAKRLAQQPLCPKCFLRDPHECLKANGFQRRGDPCEM